MMYEIRRKLYYGTLKIAGFIRDKVFCAAEESFNHEINGKKMVYTRRFMDGSTHVTYIDYTNEIGFVKHEATGGIAKIYNNVYWIILKVAEFIQPK